MRKDGTITHRERDTVQSCLRILGNWLQAHGDDEQTPYGYYEINEAYSLLSDNLWTMEEE